MQTYMGLTNPIDVCIGELKFCEVYLMCIGYP